ncbi:MAG: trypsin-like serine protease, partial [Thermoleophilaceae bacterium]|nr:trypsin-like serine protease [Thermoleophilaceae bacterium]
MFLIDEKDATKTEPASTKTCTGTLVARSVVLTAAHCVDNDPDRVRVFAGLLDLATAPSAPNDFLVTRIQESRDFEKGSKTVKPNDIAYLELGRNATQTPSSMSYDRPKAGADGRSRGYGAIAENVVDGKPVVPPEGANTLLREGLVRIVDCPKGAYKDVFCSNYTKSTPGIGPCRGDSGGPLLSASSKKLVGVFSGSAAGCKTN